MSGYWGMNEIPALYEVARQTCHELGLPWTDPRTGITHQPPTKVSKRKKKRLKKKRS